MEEGKALFEDLPRRLKAKEEKSRGSRTSSSGFTKKNALAVANRTPEAFCKLTGVTRSVNHASNHIDYISRNGKVELEDEQGNLFSGSRLGYEITEQWKNISKFKQFQDPDPMKNKSRYTTTLVFSMVAGTDEEKLKDSVRQLMKEEFGGKHKYVMGLHTDTNSPHVHVCILNKGLNKNKKLHLSRAKTKQLRAKFAEKLVEHGIKAVATPRQMRGVIDKSDNKNLKKIKERLAKKGETLEKDKKLAKTVILEVKGLTPKKEQRGEKKMLQEQKEIRDWYADIIANSKDLTIDERKKILEYAKTLPSPETRRMKLENSLANNFKMQEQTNKQVVDHSKQNVTKNISTNDVER